MYKIIWDKTTGGIQLNLHVVENTLSVSPRPVFYEELDLLKLNDVFPWIWLTLKSQSNVKSISTAVAIPEQGVGDVQIRNEHS